jgi:hypothetical protein
VEPNLKKSLVVSRILVTLGAAAILALLLAFVFTEPGNRIAARESAAARSIRTIYLANVAYADDHPQQGYARNLNDLAEHPANASPGTDRDRLVNLGLASGERVGYKFTYSAQSTKGDGKLDAFQVTADPLVPGKTGNHHFFVDQTGIFRISKDGPANSSSDVLQ